MKFCIFFIFQYEPVKEEVCDFKELQMSSDEAKVTKEKDQKERIIKTVPPSGVSAYIHIICCSVWMGLYSIHSPYAV